MTSVKPSRMETLLGKIQESGVKFRKMPHKDAGSEVEREMIVLTPPIKVTAKLGDTEGVISRIYPDSNTIKVALRDGSINYDLNEEYGPNHRMVEWSVNERR